MNKTDVLNNLKSLGMNEKMLSVYRDILDNILDNRFYLYFDDQGPKNCLFSYILQDNFLRKYIIKIDPNLERLNDKQRAYYRFLMIVSFNIKINFTADEIDEFFDSDKMNEKGIEYILNMPVIFSINDRKYFKDYYDKKYGNNFIINSLLSKMNNNHYCLLKFLNDTINFNITSNQDCLQKIKSLYGLDIISEEQLIKIIKFIFYSFGFDRQKLINIIKNSEFEILLTLYLKITSNFDIKELYGMIINYHKNQDLYKVVYNLTDFSNSEKIMLYKLLISGNNNISATINNRNDLTNYYRAMYEENTIVTNANSISKLKDSIFKNLFNIGLPDIKRMLTKYKHDRYFHFLKDNLSNENLKQMLDQYCAILEFMLSIYESNDLDCLKEVLRKINKLYQSNNLDLLYNLWCNFMKIDQNIMDICNSELTEKITIFEELLNTNEQDIPVINGDRAFKLSSMVVDNDFEYDGVKICKGKEVKMIELNGLPFVSVAHVLNGIHMGGKISDFNHPRMFGSTIISMSTIDDNYYKLLKGFYEDGIDNVTVLFDNLSSYHLITASPDDASSSSLCNSLCVLCRAGNYLPVRKNLANIKYDYSEYLYYRENINNQINIKPSAILIRKDEPSKSEIQAAAYLNVPLVKINREKYPIRTKEEREERDIELKPFYEELYKKRNKKIESINIDKLKCLREQLMNLYKLDDDPISKKAI